MKKFGVTIHSNVLLLTQVKKINSGNQSCDSGTLNYTVCFKGNFSTADDAEKETEGSPPLKKLKQLDLKQMKQGEKDKRYVYII